MQNTNSRIKKCDAQSCIMWLTATFGAITDHAKSFATPRFIRLLDFFFLLKNSARNFFLTRNICSIFFLGFAQPPIKNQMVHPLDCFAHKFGFVLSTQRVTLLVTALTDMISSVYNFLVLNFCTQGFLWGVLLCLKIGSWKEMNREIFLWMLLFFCPSFSA